MIHQSPALSFLLSIHDLLLSLSWIFRWRHRRWRTWHDILYNELVIRMCLLALARDAYRGSVHGCQLNALRKKVWEETIKVTASNSHCLQTKLSVLQHGLRCQGTNLSYNFILLQLSLSSAFMFSLTEESNVQGKQKTTSRWPDLLMMLSRSFPCTICFKMASSPLSKAHFLSLYIFTDRSHM